MARNTQVQDVRVAASILLDLLDGLTLAEADTFSVGGEADIGYLRQRLGRMLRRGAAKVGP